MTDIASGYEIAGEPANNPDSDEAFNASLARAVDKSESVNASVEEDAQPSDPERDSAESIREAVLSREVSPTLAAGLTVATERKSKEGLTPEVQTLVDEANRLEAEEKAAVGQIINELAYRQALDVIGDPDLLDPDVLTEEELVAVMELRESAPEVYAALIEHLDDHAIEESAEWDPYADLDEEYPDGLPGVRLHQVAELAESYLREAQSEQLANQIMSRDVANKVEAISNYYETEGVDPDDFASAWEMDSETLMGLGFDPSAMEPLQIVLALALHTAAYDEAVSEERKNAFRAEMLNAPDTDISSGLEVLGPFGYMPVQPRHDGIKRYAPGELAARVGARTVARESAKHRPLTVDQFRRQMVAAEPASVKDGLTGPDGRPISVDDATGAKRRHEDEQRRQRAEALAFLPGRRA